jgi:hypothetical protein
MDDQPDIGGIINACDDKCGREGFASLSPQERAV